MKRRNTVNNALTLIVGIGTSTTIFAKKDYPSIYPFIPEQTSKIYSDIQNISEDKNFIKNFNDILEMKLSRGKTATQPWTSSYWPLSKGTIADPYEDSTIVYYVQPSWVIWENNYNAFEKRKEEVHAKINELSDEELAKLAPSEKYDLLIGDKSFDLTNRLWKYMKSWGKKKELGFLLNRPELIGEDALEIARSEIDNYGWHKDIDHAFTNSYRLNGSLSVQYAKELVESGKYNSVVDAFPEALDMAKKESNSYVMEKKSKLLAGWEGICNGWSTAAGIIPRPRKAVSFKLPDGRNLKFYPSDIKGLISLYWVNSLIQDYAQRDDKGKVTSGGTISAGLRCNLQSTAKDEWGRLYDQEPDPFANSHDSRCAGVHPATWHLGLVNIIGKQKRSFVVERKVDAAVDNHPMHSYKMKYFNPYTGKHEENIDDNIELINDHDVFKKFRSPKAKYIVGVETTMQYLNYQKPSRTETDSEEDDATVDKEMFYDLELDENYNIVGGQWRAVKRGKPRRVKRPGQKVPKLEDLNHNQPDFFWTVTKDWKKTGLFDNENLSAWKDKTQAPPSSWLAKAKESHAFEYKQTYQYGTGQKCRMYNVETKEWRHVSCEMSYNKPQPLINVLNALIERAK